jgi:hypothetical protein
MGQNRSDNEMMRRVGTNQDRNRHSDQDAGDRDEMQKE